MSEEKKQGIVKWFDYRKGYRFIAVEGGGDVFVHITDIEGRQELSEDDRVEFEIEETQKGLGAIGVTKIGPPASFS